MKTKFSSASPTNHITRDDMLMGGDWDERLPGHEYKDKDEEPAKKWPPGYWERYEGLRASARKICGREAPIIVLLSGYYAVQYTDARGREVRGPVCSDRHDAYEKFIATYEA